MAKSTYIDLNYAHFSIKFKVLIMRIESALGEPYNPDDFLAEGQALSIELEKTHEEETIAYYADARLDTAEDHAFEKLTTAMAKMKTAVDVLAGKKYWGTLDIPSRMPRSREKVRESARAVLSAWDEHSADPELAHVIPAMDELRTAFDAWTSAWDAQQDANRIKKEKYRASREARAKCDKFISRVKKYLSLHLAPDDPRWGLYGFEARGEE